MTDPGPCRAPGWCRSLLRALALLLVALPAGAGEVPYRLLYRVLAPSLAIERFPRLVAVQRVESKLPGVRGSEIELSILSRQGIQRIRVDDDYRVRFPLDEALLAEDPLVRSNQPQGSLAVSVTFEIALNDQRILRYQDLLEGMQQAEQALGMVERQLADRRVAGIEFLFPADTGASLTIIDARREELLLANAAGFIRLRRDPALADSSAEVRLSTTPLRAIPFLDQID